jgi:hypothetical protein
MPDEPTQAPVAEPTPAPAVTPQSDPVSAYHKQVAALATADLTGYVDPHFEGRDPDAEEFGTADPDAEPFVPEQAQDEQERIIEQDTPPNDPDAPLPTDEQPPVDGSKPPQFRLRPATDDDVGTKALWLLKRNPDMKLEAALAEAKALLGKTDDAPAAPEQFPDEPIEAPPNVEQLEAERADLKARRKEARKNLDYDALAEIEDRLDDLEEQVIPQAREAEARKQQQEHGAFTESATKAAELYPDAANEASELYQRMEEIDQTLRETGDPLFNDPNKPLRIAQMAAKELAIAPKRKGQAQPPAAAPVQQPRPLARVSMTAPLAAPGARSSPPPVSAFEQQINAVSSEEEYLALKQQLVGLR